MSPKDILNFWFEEIEPQQQFTKDPDFDQEIRQRFGKVYEQIVSGETTHWRATPEGRLAEIIVLDQFSRNMFRDSPKAFQADPLALQLAQEAVHLKVDQAMPMNQRSFFYMPYMHSEDPKIHEQAMKLFDQKGLENGLKFEILHKKIIDRFGRYPHRNKILGRKSTKEEIEFLQEANSSF